ncbi:MAG: hypothetical protein BMS9Abin11_1020 [Gammaproteobacteria bacterium]|nr:MAG: hypothetical protein BMS9Abin11_1020 [Gammaproteobacteria bacterium]
MAVVLGGVTLSNHLIWEDEDTYSSVASSVKRTLAGSVVYRDQTLTLGRPITLVAKVDQGWLTKAQVDAVRTLANVAGAVYSLTVGTQNFNVKFRHHESPAFTADALIKRNNPSVNDYYTCTIKLMTV